MPPEVKACSGCRRGFYPSHGNQKFCGACRARGRLGTRTYGCRVCDYCGRLFVALAPHQRWCTPSCRYRGRVRDATALYANPQHRGTRERLAPLVATGTVRCARGGACREATLVEGRLVGGLIRPGQAWHLGHPDGESAGGPEHAACNSSAPMRLRKRAETAR